MWERQVRISCERRLSCRMWSTSVPSSVPHFSRVWDLSLSEAAQGWSRYSCAWEGSWQQECAWEQSPLLCWWLYSRDFGFKSKFLMEGGDSESGCSLTSMWALLTEVFQIWLRIKEEIPLFIVSLGHTAHNNSCWKAAGRGLGLALIADAYSAEQFLPNPCSAPSSAQWKAKLEVASIDIFASWTEGVYFLSNICSSVLF